MMCVGIMCIYIYLYVCTAMLCARLWMVYLHTIVKRPLAKSANILKF